MDDSKPLFVQIADDIESQILSGSLREEERAPSTNELAVFHRINPATAAKGINTLVDRGILHKRRGLGMFVAVGAHQRLQAERRQQFADKYLAPLLKEARAVGITPDTVIELIQTTAAKTSSETEKGAS